MTTHWLQITRGAAMVAMFQVTGALYRIGRAPECDIILQGPGVSRRHAELIAAGEGWVIADLTSRNGTLVNGALLTEPRRLESGDTVQIDVFELVLHRELAVADESDGTTRTVLELAPPHSPGGALAAMAALNGALLAAASRQQRRRLMGALMIGPELQAASVMFVALRPGDPEGAPTLLGEPLVAAGGRAPALSRQVLASLLAGGATVLASTPGDPGGAGPDEAHEAILAAVLTATADELEVLYAALPAACATAEWRTLVTAATSFYRQAEDVWAARQAIERQAQLAGELERAHDLQQRLVPADFRFGWIDVAFGFEPCKGVGGDYVDAIPMTDGRVLLVAMDVAGKGMDAALIASGLHTTVRICAMQWFSLTELIRLLNRYLIATWDVMTSVTVAASVLDPRSGVIESINCGHPAPMIVAGGGRARELAAYEAIPLGFMDFDIYTRTDRLRPGEMLAYYSDGLTELFDERDVMLGAEGVAAHLIALRGLAGPGGAAALVAELNRRLAAYRGRASPSDDISFILVLSDG